MTDNSCPPLDLEFRYRIVGEGDIDTFSPRFYDYASKKGKMTCGNGSYLLGPQERRVLMTIGSQNATPEVVLVSQHESTVKLVEKFVQKRFGFTLERISGSKRERK